MTRLDHRGARQTRVDDEAALVKAERLFGARGYRRTSVQDIVDATGMRRDRIYGASSLMIESSTAVTVAVTSVCVAPSVRDFDDTV